MTISAQEKSQYERQCNAAAGYCAACTKPLQPGEVYACNECAHEAYVETDPNFSIAGEGDE
ncbi:UNVERIFIED_ORG: hypothetical protein J2Y78_003790 [Buttiauxella agrestis ATCC 33320]